MIIEFLANNWQFSISLGLAILSIIITLYFELRRRKVKKLLYSIRSFNFTKDFENKDIELKQSYRGQFVKQFTVSRIALWNGGNTTIKNDDIAPADPLRVELNSNYNLYDTPKILFTTSKANNVTVKLANNSVTVSFDYLDRGHGGIIEIIHNGASSEDVQLCGQIKKIGSPTPRWISTTSIAGEVREEIREKSIPFTGASLGLLVSWTIIFLLIGLGIISGGGTSARLYLFFGVLLLLITVIAHFIVYRRLMLMQLPKYFGEHFNKW